MFKRRYYEQAMKCFEHSQDTTLRNRALAYSLAEDASKAQSEADSLQYRLDDQHRTLDKAQRRALKEQIKNFNDKAIQIFNHASKVFLEIGLLKQAAQCLYTAKAYKEAAKIFEGIGYYS